MQLSIDEVVELILTKNNINPEEFVRKPRAEHPGWTNRYFIELIVKYGVGPAVVSAEGCGEQTFNRAVKKLLHPITGPLHGGNETFKNKLFNLASIKYCPKCNQVLDYSLFDNDKNDSYGKAGVCKLCTSIKNAKFYEENKDRYHKPYIHEHWSEYIARNALRKARKLKATPSWANLALIKEIYLNAEGDHVDHIIPLQGETVCGLHVENNLQYLSPKDNMAKGNKLLEEFTTSNY